MKLETAQHLSQGFDTGKTIAAGTAGGGASWWLGNINEAVAIGVGLVTFVYVSLKIYAFIADRRAEKVRADDD